jgi:hypothetical protein
MAAAAQLSVWMESVAKEMADRTLTAVHKKRKQLSDESAAVPAAKPLAVIHHGDVLDLSSEALRSLHPDCSCGGIEGRIVWLPCLMLPREQHDAWRQLAASIDAASVEAMETCLKQAGLHCDFAPRGPGQRGHLAQVLVRCRDVFRETDLLSGIGAFDFDAASAVPDASYVAAAAREFEQKFGVLLADRERALAWSRHKVPLIAPLEPWRAPQDMRRGYNELARDVRGSRVGVTDSDDIRAWFQALRVYVGSPESLAAPPGHRS